MTKIESFKVLSSLACGTIASITGITNYDKQDEYLKNLFELIECLPDNYFKDCNCWQHCFQLLQKIDFINIEMHNDVITKTEKITKTEEITKNKTIIKIKRYDDLIEDIEIDENENCSRDKYGKFYIDIITLDS